MIVYGIWDTETEEFISNTDNPDEAKAYFDLGYEVTSVAVENLNDMWSEYQI